jgi:hypothetical protein
VNNEEAWKDMSAAADKLRAGDTDVPPRLAEPIAGWMLGAAEVVRSKWCPTVDRRAGCWVFARLVLDGPAEPAGSPLTPDEVTAAEWRGAEWERNRMREAMEDTFPDSTPTTRAVLRLVGPPRSSRLRLLQGGQGGAT